MKQPEFEAFRESHATLAATNEVNYDKPGVVLVWRQPDGLAVHAAVTLGDGWVVNKPAQCGWAPRFVWTLPEVSRHHEAPDLVREAYLIT